MSTKAKLVLSVVGLGLVVALVLFVNAKRRAAASGWPLAVSATAQGASRAGGAPLPRGFPLLAPIGTPMPATSGEPPQSIHDSKEYAQKIEDTDAFRSFASRASLDPNGQREVSHIVALYYMDDASLVASSFDNTKLASMRRQLRRHMDARVRAKIPPSSWDAFEQSGLLPTSDPESNGPT
jgi:hypothetical protein